MTHLLYSPTFSYMPPIPTVRANAQAIRAFCDKDGLTIDGLAKRAGVSGSAVHYYVHGTKHPTLRMLNKLARALGVPTQAICMNDLTGMNEVIDAGRQSV